MTETSLRDDAKLERVFRQCVALEAELCDVRESMALVTRQVRRNQADLDRIAGRLDERLEDLRSSVKRTLRIELDKAFGAVEERLERRLSQMSEDLEQLKGKR
jgi:FKBP-type peptidyl-prolyl cis-trans isomerase 2